MSGFLACFMSIVVAGSIFADDKSFQPDDVRFRPTTSRDISSEKNDQLAARHDFMWKTNEEIDWNATARELGFSERALDPSDKEAEPILRSLDYSKFLPDLPLDCDDVDLSPYRMLVAKDYKSVAAELKPKIIDFFVSLNDPSFDLDVDAARRIRYQLHVYARALEFEGYGDFALGVYRMLRRHGEDHMIMARLNYRRRSLGGEPAFGWHDKNYFEWLCRDVLARYRDVDFDKIVAAIEEARSADPTGERFSAIPLPEDSKYYEEALRLYELRDLCAQVANPRLHFMVDLTTDEAGRVKLALASRRSYQVFAETMEHTWDTWYDVKTLYIQLAEGMEVVRNLSKLPY